MFNYGNANEAQKEAISATDGLVLITAGPGTGKTFTLVKRAVYLIQECGIKPEQIMMATFTEKAAKELITRITNELAEKLQFSCQKRITTRSMMNFAKIIIWRFQILVNPQIQIKKCIRFVFYRRQEVLR